MPTSWRKQQPECEVARHRGKLSSSVAPQLIRPRRWHHADFSSTACLQMQRAAFVPFRLMDLISGVCGETMRRIPSARDHNAGAFRLGRLCRWFSAHLLLAFQQRFTKRQASAPRPARQRSLGKFYRRMPLLSRQRCARMEGDYPWRVSASIRMAAAPVLRLFATRHSISLLQRGVSRYGQATPSSRRTCATT